QAGEPEIYLARHARVDVASLSDEVLDEFQAGHIAGTIGRRVVVSTAGFAHRGNHMQWRVAWAHGVRIGACVDQECGELIMRITDGNVQGARIGLGCAMNRTAPTATTGGQLYGFVDVRSGLQQSFHSRNPALPDCEKERRETRT